MQEQKELADKFKKITNMYSQEIKLIRTIIIASITVISLCIVLYFNYILIGQFFTTIFLSLVASFVLRSTKDSIISHFEYNIQDHKYYVSYSYFIKTLKAIYISIRTIFESLVLLKPIKIVDKFSNIHNKFVTNYLYFIVFIYVIIFKLDIYLTLIIISIILGVDLIIRICLDVLIIMVRSIKDNYLLRSLIFQDNKTLLNQNVHSIVALILISLFLVLILITILLSLWLIYIDIKSVYKESNSNYSDFINRIIPRNITDLSDHFNNFYKSNLFTHIKTLEEYINI
jgi:hypothetical protein